MARSYPGTEQPVNLPVLAGYLPGNLSGPLRQLAAISAALKAAL